MKPMKVRNKRCNLEQNENPSHNLIYRMINEIRKKQIKKKLNNEKQIFIMPLLALYVYFRARDKRKLYIKITVNRKMVNINDSVEMT